jgi:menaquinol-cytochrome c reductase iron-sulfur subunit
MLKWTIRGIGLAFASMVGIPAFFAGFSPVFKRRTTQNVWRSLGPVDNFPIGEMRQVVVALPEEPWGGPSLTEQAVYAWRPSEQEAIVYSRSCTDLGCPLTFDPGSQCFFCPCHGGIFDKNGARMAGPPPRPMDRYATRITNGEIMIDLNSVPPMS